MIFGGQLRITRLLTPGLHDRVMRDKEAGTAEALYPIIPIKGPATQRRFVGVLMVGTGVLLANPGTRGSMIRCEMQDGYGERGPGVGVWEL